MKVKRIPLRAYNIVEFFIKHKRERVTKVIEGLPEGSKFLRAYYEPNTDTYYLLFESEEFEEVLEGAAIPIFNPVFESNEVKI